MIIITTDGEGESNNYETSDSYDGVCVYTTHHIDEADSSYRTPSNLLNFELDNTNKPEKTLYEGFLERDNDTDSDGCSTLTAVESRPTTIDSNKGLDIQIPANTPGSTDSPSRSAEIFTTQTLKVLEDQVKVNEENLNKLDSLKVSEDAKDLAKEKLLE